MCAAPVNHPRASMLGRATRVLDAFGPGEGALALAELTRRCGLAKPTVHRLAGELVELGLLDREEGGYRLGLGLLELGQRSWWQRELRDRAVPFLENLRRRTRRGVNLALLSGSEVVYLERFADPGSGPWRVGSRLPAHATALGKAILAHSPTSALREVFAGGLPRAGPRSITAPRMLTRELLRVRSAGVAVDVEESHPGMLCAAAAVFAAPGRPVAGLSVSGCGTVAQLRELGPLVASAAGGLSRRLAHAPVDAVPAPRSG